MNFITFVVRQVLRVAIVLGLAGLIYIGSVVAYDKHYSREAYIKHYQDLYNDIGRQSGQVYPPLRISDSMVVNAFATENEVIVTKGMLEFVNNDDELAMVLGHEISHFILKHVFQPNLPGMGPIENMMWDLQKEENADKLGAFLALQAGYDVCNGRQVWLRLHNAGDALENTSHPHHIFRYVNLKMPSCRGEL